VKLRTYLRPLQFVDENCFFQSLLLVFMDGLGVGHFVLFICVMKLV
jgi:hypothetical protein